MATRADTVNRILVRIVNPARMEIVNNFANIFGASSGKRRTQNNSNWNPQEWRGALNCFLRGQGIGLCTLLKRKNTTYSQMPATIEGRCELMGGEAALSTKPEKGCSEKCKINMQNVQAIPRTVIKNERVNGYGQTS